MGKIKAMLPTLALLTLTGCASPAYKDTILDYAEYMGITYLGDSIQGSEMIPYGEVTMPVFDEGDDIFGLLAIRYDEREENIIGLVVFGSLSDDMTMVAIEEMGIYDYSIEFDEGRAIELEASPSMNEPYMIVNCEEYVKNAESLTYSDIAYAMNALSERKY